MEVVKTHKCFEGFTEFYKHQSEVTKTEMKFSLHRPKDEQQITGALIWLSGLTCNEENFITKAGAQKFLADTGLVVVCPDTSPRGLGLPQEHDSYDFGSGASFYVNATAEGYRDHYQMDTYINSELYNLINSRFNLQNRISIFGHSMGGHGALVSGLANSDQYRSISAFSPVANPVQCEWGRKAFKGYLGDDQSEWHKYDACELLKSGKSHSAPILVDQGMADEFLQQQLLTPNLEKAAKEAGQECTVRYHEGYDHSYYFISTFVGEHIKFHLEFLN